MRQKGFFREVIPAVHDLEDPKGRSVLMQAVPNRMQAMHSGCYSQQCMPHLVPRTSCWNAGALVVLLVLVLVLGSALESGDDARP